MFWIDIPFGLALLVIVIYLIDRLLDRIVDKIEAAHRLNNDRMGRKVYDIYRQVERLNPDERKGFLDNQTRTIRRLYKKGVSYWGEPQ